MRPKSKTLTATGSTAWIPVNYRQEDFNIGIQIDVTGTITSWAVEVTMDDVFDSTVTPVAVAAPSPLDTGTTDEIGALTVPCRAIRLTATITSGSVKMTVVQGN
jgi:hypothetical protein